MESLGTIPQSDSLETYWLGIIGPPNITSDAIGPRACQAPVTDDLRRLRRARRRLGHLKSTARTAMALRARRWLDFTAPCVLSAAQRSENGRFRLTGWGRRQPRSGAVRGLPAAHRAVDLVAVLIERPGRSFAAF